MTLRPLVKGRAAGRRQRKVLRRAKYYGAITPMPLGTGRQRLPVVATAKRKPVPAAGSNPRTAILPARLCTPLFTTGAAGDRLDRLLILLVLNPGHRRLAPPG
jgi:hypothetical protein